MQQMAGGAVQVRLSNNNNQALLWFSPCTSPHTNPAQAACARTSIMVRVWLMWATLLLVSARPLADMFLAQ